MSYQWIIDALLFLSGFFRHFVTSVMGVAILLAVFLQCISTASTMTRLVSGDLIFVEPPLDPRQPLDNAILDTGAATIAWLRTQGYAATGNTTVSHVAMVSVAPNGTKGVVQAVPPAVVHTAWEDFLHEMPPGTNLYRGTSLQPPLPVDTGSRRPHVPRWPTRRPSG